MLEILPYTAEKKNTWDNFLFNDSVNGTFLQSQNFLDYHPKDRFLDASLIVHNSGTYYALLPGVQIGDSFVSHPGSTFGGPIFANHTYCASRVFEVLETIDTYLKKKYQHASFKITPNLFSKKSSDLLEYALEHLGYFRHTELSAYTPLNSIKDPLENCAKDCRRIFKKSENYETTYGEINSLEDFKCFYKLLEISKAKHNTKPVHTLEELLELKNSRIPNNILFRGLWHKQTLVAGIMLFLFPETRVIHAQYIATEPDFNLFQPTTAIDILIMREAAKLGFEIFSWGISTEEKGMILNHSLMHFKESFGAIPVVNAFYTKDF